MFKVHHVALSVSDINKSLEFYKKFGFIKIFEWKNKDLIINHLKLDDFILELFSFKNYDKLPKKSQNLLTDLPEIGVKYFGIKVDNLEEIKKFFLEKKLAKKIEISLGRTGIKYFFIKDPDGILLEFVEDNRKI